MSMLAPLSLHELDQMPLEARVQARKIQTSWNPQGYEAELRGPEMASLRKELGSWRSGTRKDTHPLSSSQMSSEHLLCANHFAGSGNMAVSSQTIQTSIIPPVAVTHLKTTHIKKYT